MSLFCSYWRPWLIASGGEYVNKSTLWGRERDLAWPNIKCLSLPGCHNKIPPTRGLTEQAFISHSSGGWKFWMRVPTWPGSWWGPCWWPATPYVLPWWSQRESKLSSYRGTKPMRGADTLTTSYNLNITWEMVSQRHHLQIESLWGLGCNIGTFSP